VGFINRSSQERLLTLMRRYEPAWLTLKKHGRITISAPVEKHPNVIRMISKEKYMDKEFKAREKWRMKFITYRIKGCEITFTLEYRINDLTKGDL